MEAKEIHCPHCGLPFHVVVSSVKIQVLVKDEASKKKDIPDEKTLQFAREAQ